MTRVQLSVAAIVLASSFVLPAPIARAGVAMGGEDCGKRVKITAKLVRQLEGVDDAYAGGGKLPPFLLAIAGEASEKTQYLFVKRKKRWRAVIFTQNAPAQAIHIAPRHGSAVMFGMWGVEGPGKDYTVLSSRDGFRSVQCNVLPTPPEPKEDPGNYILKYMSLTSFGADRRGRATITGEVDWDDNNRVTRYVARARLGHDWTVPRRTKLKSAAPGVFRPLTSSGKARLLRDLRRSVGLRR